jgi:hypothetical protein
MQKQKQRERLDRSTRFEISRSHSLSASDPVQFAFFFIIIFSAGDAHRTQARKSSDPQVNRMDRSSKA